MTNEESEFAARGYVGRHHQYRQGNRRLLEMDISRELFHDFAWCWCRGGGIIDLFKYKFKIVGYFSSKHPCHERSEITIYLERVR